MVTWPGVEKEPFFIQVGDTKNNVLDSRYTSMKVKKKATKNQKSKKKKKIIITTIVPVRQREKT